MYRSMSFFTTRVVSSLEKVFCRESLDAAPMEHFRGAGNETVAFQFCCKAPLACEGVISIDSELAHFFRRLARWIKMAKACGFEYFEMSHAFTQWGAKHASKIIVRENGCDIQKFGWATDASSGEYRSFLRQLMSRLIPFLKRHEITPENCFFHISDEPGADTLESYGSAALFFREILNGYPVIDALLPTRRKQSGSLISGVEST